ncbi:hypothetical protein VNO77_11563 [Canavalia gladiata]|uniref:Uncharacterized protein n=1 Tax=Canavalia gladiata TaxID=3824 RepID=A0AAN9MI73_CANGL
MNGLQRLSHVSQYEWTRVSWDGSGSLSFNGSEFLHMEVRLRGKLCAVTVIIGWRNKSQELSSGFGSQPLVKEMDWPPGTCPKTTVVQGLVNENLE